MRPQKLSLDRVTLRYPTGTVAVNGVSLDVAPGEIFALVGPNGSGKSSLLNCAAGLLRPQRGRVAIGGVDVTGRPDAASRFLSLMPDPLGLYNDLSVEHYLEFFARAFDIPPPQRPARIAAACARLGLDPWRTQDVGTLSAGWQRRVALARSVLAEAPVLLLDEPAAGLDVIARESLLHLIQDLAAEGRTIVVTSHILSELERLATRFGIIQNGAWVPFRADQIFFTRDEMSTRSGGAEWTVRCDDVERARAILGEAVRRVSNDSLVFAAADDGAASALLGRLLSEGLIVRDFRVLSSDLTQLTLEMLEKHPGGPHAG
jgi:ABC-2 type transport system ATP-binding protein